MDLSDRLLELNSRAEPLLARLYFCKTQFSAVKRPSFLNDNTFSKVRTKIVKAFPSTIASLGDTEINKIGGWDQFSKSAFDIASELSMFHNVLHDLVSFVESSRDVLTSLPQHIMELQLSKNRHLLILFYNLLCSFVRAVWLFGSIEDYKMIVLVTETATSIAHEGQIPNAYHTGVVKLTAEVENTHMFLIETLCPLHDTLKFTIVQFRETLVLADSINTMRDGNVLCPHNDFANVYKSACEQLSPTVAVSKYTELQDAERYKDYIALSFLVCPHLFYDSELVQLFDLALQHKHFVPLYRDLMINIHIELEVVSQFFPSVDSSLFSSMTSAATRVLTITAIGLPPPPNKAFKLRPILKATAKTATKSAGLRQRAKRFFYRTELEMWNRILSNMPGLIGPRLPQIHALLVLSKAEIVECLRQLRAFFAVNSNTNNNNINNNISINNAINGSNNINNINTNAPSTHAFRKDVKKHFIPSNYECPDLMMLLGEHMKLVTLLRRSDMQEVIRQYYVEYLVGLDNQMLQRLCEEASQALPTLSEYFHSFRSTLDHLSTLMNKNNNNNDNNDNNESDSSNNNAHEHLETLRVNWLTCSSLLSMKTMISECNRPAIKSLMIRMQSIFERTRYIDQWCDMILPNDIEPFECRFFRDELLSLFDIAVHSPSQLSQATFAAVLAMTCNTNNDHNNNNNTNNTNNNVQIINDDIQISELKDKEDSIAVAERMVSILEAQVLSLIRPMWDSLSSLEAKSNCDAAGKRIARIMQYKARIKSVNNNNSNSNNNENYDINNNNGNNVDLDDPRHDPLPGCESEAFAKSSIEKLIQVRENLINLMESIRDIGDVHIHGRSVPVVTKLRARLESYLEEQVVLLIRSAFDGYTRSMNASTYFSNYNLTSGGSNNPNNPNNSNSELSRCRPSHIRARLRSLVHCLQTALSVLDESVGGDLRKVLFRQCLDLHVGPPGSPIVPLDLGSGGSGGDGEGGVGTGTSPPAAPELLGVVADWLGAMVGYLSGGSSGGTGNLGVVYVPYLQEFVRVPSVTRRRSLLMSSWNVSLASSSHIPYQPPSAGSLLTEAILNRRELSHLVEVLGVQGVRSIDRELLASVWDKVLHIRDFLTHFEDTLRDVLRNTSSVVDVFFQSAALRERLSSVFQALVHIGVTLAVRSSLHEALGIVFQSHPVASSVPRVVAAASRGTDGRSRYVPSLAWDLGVGPSNEADVSLREALRPLFQDVNNNNNTNNTNNNTTNNSSDVFSLLPVMGAMIFLVEDWKKASFSWQFGVFHGNEHCALFGLWRIMESYFGRSNFVQVRNSLTFTIRCPNNSVNNNNITNTNTSESINSSDTLIQLKSMIGSSQVISNKSAKIDISRFDLEEHFGLWFMMFSQVNACIKSQWDINNNNSSNSSNNMSNSNNSSLSSLPTEGFLVILDSLMHGSSSKLPRSLLERFVPYNLVHQAAMNAAYGKLRGGDSANLPRNNIMDNGNGDANGATAETAATFDIDDGDHRDE